MDATTTNYEAKLAAECAADQCVPVALVDREPDGVVGEVVWVDGVPYYSHEDQYWYLRKRGGGIGYGVNLAAREYVGHDAGGNEVRRRKAPQSLQGVAARLANSGKVYASPEYPGGAPEFVFLTPQQFESAVTFP